MSREKRVVRFLRAGFRWWPFLHGRGWLVRLARLVLGDNLVVFDIGSGTLIEGPLDDWIILWPFMRGHERDKSFQRSLELLEPNGVAFDIGAHVGIWSLLAARRVPSSQIHAFEPVPERREQLLAHMAMNDVNRITVNPCAVGATDGTVSFFAVHDGNTGTSSLVRHHTADVEICVPMSTLDSYVEKSAIDRVDVMKVDVEGAELLVFSGARKLLSGDDAPAIFFEADDRLSSSFGVSSRDVKRLLVEYGYAIYCWRDSTFAPVTVEEPNRQEDLFALKPRHLAGKRQS